MPTTDSQTCNDPQPHGSHTWYSPASDGKGQDQHNCPGVE